MKKYLAFVSAGIATIAMFCAAPAMARDDVNWSITVGSAGYPPPVVYGPPRVVYERVQPVVVERRTIVRHGHRGEHRSGHYRDHDGHYRHESRHHRHHDHRRYSH
jgi:hypothetical protein